MPLVRFKTGDICIAHTLPCACGRNSLRLSPVLGRKNQMIKYKGTTVYPGAIYDVLDAIQEISLYQLEVCSTEFDTDDIHIYLSFQKTNQLVLSEENINQMLQSKVRVSAQVHFLSEKNLQERVYPENSRKAIKFIDSRK